MKSLFIIFLSTVITFNVAFAQKDTLMTDSGLKYIILKSGKDPKPSPFSTVVVDFKVRLPDGKIIDNTSTTGAATIKLDEFGLTKGFAEGTRLIGKGGRILLFIPPELAYGERGLKGKVPPNTPLFIDLKLWKIK